MAGWSWSLRVLYVGHERTTRQHERCFSGTVGMFVVVAPAAVAAAIVVVVVDIIVGGGSSRTGGGALQTMRSHRPHIYAAT